MSTDTLLPRDLSKMRIKMEVILQLCISGQRKSLIPGRSHSLEEVKKRYKDKAREEGFGEKREPKRRPKKKGRVHRGI